MSEMESLALWMFWVLLVVQARLLNELFIFRLIGSNFYDYYLEPLLLF